jgi:hypothetical protein
MKRIIVTLAVGCFVVGMSQTASAQWYGRESKDSKTQPSTSSPSTGSSRSTPSTTPSSGYNRTAPRATSSAPAQAAPARPDLSTPEKAVNNMIGVKGPIEFKDPRTGQMRDLQLVRLENLKPIKGNQSYILGWFKDSKTGESIQAEIYFKYKYGRYEISEKKIVNINGRDVRG